MSEGEAPHDQFDERIQFNKSIEEINASVGRRLSLAEPEDDSELVSFT